MRPTRNRPRAVLFEGPPGTGKTTSAKIIAAQVGIPLMYVPLESIISKYYGEAEKNLSHIFEMAAELEGCIIFIDEIDTLGGNRDNDGMHEASRRVLSALLRRLDSFESNDNTLLICATNRKKD
jgi:ATP-dependent 26S proteasome regulatory subunit